MNTIQPNPDQIARLSLRGIVAYSLRAARRVLDRNPVEYAEPCNACLRIVSEFVVLPLIPKDLGYRVTLAASKEVAAEALSESGRILKVGLSIRAAARCCYYAVRVISENGAASYVLAAASAAVMAARQLDDVESSNLAMNDYHLLLRTFGHPEPGELGLPFNPFEDGPLGPVSRGS